MPASANLRSSCRTAAALLLDGLAGPFGPHAWDGLRDYLAGLVNRCPSGRRRS